MHNMRSSGRVALFEIETWKLEINEKSAVILILVIDVEVAKNDASFFGI